MIHSAQPCLVSAANVGGLTNIDLLRPGSCLTNLLRTLLCRCWWHHQLHGHVSCVTNHGDSFIPVCQCWWPHQHHRHVSLLTSHGEMLIQEHWFTQHTSYSWPVLRHIVKLIHIHPFYTTGNHAHGYMGVFTFPQCSHAAAGAFFN